MKLKLLSEGFDFDKPDDKNKLAETRQAVVQLQKIINNTKGSRISIIRRLLKDIKETINLINIESNEEREHIDRILSLISATIDLLNALPDGPPPEDATTYISMLTHSIYDFCIHHMHRGGNAI